MNEYPSTDIPSPRPSSGSANSSSPSDSASQRLRCMCRPLPVRWENGLGMNVASMPASAARLCTM